MTTTGEPGAAVALRPLVDRLLGGRIPLRFAFWDGSTIEPTDVSDAVGAFDLQQVSRRLKEAGTGILYRHYGLRALLHVCVFR